MNKKQELITLLLKELQTNNDNSLTTAEMSEKKFLLFSNEEIIKMNKSFRKQFRFQGCTAHYRKRVDERYNCSYEIRYAKRPYNDPPITASGSTLEKAKENFIKKINNYVPQSNVQPKTPTNFKDFSEYWFENFHKRKVGNRTYNENYKKFKKYIVTYFGNIKLKDITALSVQKLLDSLVEKHRVQEDVNSILNQVFTTAIKHGIISVNPVAMCFIKKQERVHGKALKKGSETKLLTAFENSPIQITYAVLLYTGLRPNEYETAIIDGDFIKAKNSKRKNDIIEFKYIPITPMLRPYLKNVTELPKINTQVIYKKFKRILPEHRLYDLRTTFQTRCSECEIPDNVIGIWMGNSIGVLKKAYTDFSKEYLLKQAEKIKY